MAKRNKTFKKEQHVCWKWGRGTAEAQVKREFKSDITRQINGKPVTRKASPEKPAYLLQQDDGQEVLKSATELQPA
jgi:Hypervirulence associated proteins TUDOR domain